MKRLMQSDAGKPRGRNVAKKEHQTELDNDLDDMADILGGIDVILDRHAARSLQNAETRRRIEMLREEQRLQQDLSDIYD